MSGKWRVLALMTAAQAGASVVQQALGALSPVLVAQFGLSKVQLGVVFTAMLVGAACFTAAAGVLTDRWGERRMVLISGVVMTIALVAAGVVRGYVPLIAAMAVFGAGYAASTPAGGRAILAWFDRDRGFAMGIRQTGVPVGGLLGALVLPPLALRFGLEAAFLVAAVLVVIPTLVAYFGYREMREEHVETARLSTLLRGMRTLAGDPRLIAVTVTCMILVATQLAMNAFITVTAVSEIGTTTLVAALALATGQAAAMIGRLFWGWASDVPFGGDRLVPFALIAGLGAFASAVLAVLRQGDVALLFAAAALLGFSGAGWNGLFAAALAEIGGAHRAASALGLGLTAIFAASAVAPAVFGALADGTSLHLAWGLTAALALLAAGPVLWLRASRGHSSEA